ncbi:hypothetical protein DNX69_20320 [Rhodopseudomonas palustris]|uniref:Uncharacterized protein n=1 Tax=Rhodopseudomonas palustris TaxID=1076 RepID=A0A323UD67_RHOPL|nr:DUF2087 domain-containing protein [Rhodopseudomonas palustris]PZA10163.1 hypothetical protein DNX69_20320 [Rhodopseudomonas palustris]
MTRTAFPFATQDVSALARALNRELDAQGHKLGHVEMLNLLARSAGYRNFQHFRAQFDAEDMLQRQPEPEPVPDLQKVAQATRYFDTSGVLTRWPKKASHRLLCLWVMWSRVPAGRELSEKQLNELLLGHHGFGDHALLRRMLCDTGLMTRTRDGRVYRRVEQKPPPEGVALIRHLAPRLAA